MPAADADLPFLLKYDNVARYEDGEVFILDRRVYPQSTEFVRCPTYREVAKAIGDMVTQSGGPWWAAALGMVSAARGVRGLSREAAAAEMSSAAHALSHARPTTSKHMEAHVLSLAEVSLEAIQAGDDPEAFLMRHVRAIWEEDYLVMRRIGEFTNALLPDPCVILTQCFAETLIGYTLLVSKELGKKVSVICPETRPYLQGSRLTASVAYDMGIPVTVITDNMPGAILSRGMADVFLSAADVITLDGHVVNKVGTYQIALAAHANNVPYYAQGFPTRHNAKIDSVKIEERNPEEVVHALGLRTAKEGVRGYYPAFDITPPNLVSAVITPKGVFSPYNLARNFLDD